MRKVSIDKYFIISIISVIAGLLLTLIFKNTFNGHPVFRFSYSYIGDMIFILFNFFLLTAVFSIFYRNDNVLQKRIITLMLLLSLLLIVIVFFVDEIVENFEDVFVMGYPLRKFLGAFLFTASYVVSIYLMNIAFFRLTGKDGLIYVRSVVGTVIVIVALLIFSFVFTLKNYHTMPVKSEQKKSIAFVLGAAVWSKNQPSPIFKSRIEKAGKLYEEGYVGWVFVTGGNAPGEMSESEVAHQLLIGLGVDSSKILSENQTSTTSEQIKFISANPNIFRDKKIYIISDSFHHARVTEMCKFYDVDAKCSESGAELSWEKLVYFRFRESVALLLFWLFGV